MNILVLAGGISTERDVSLKSGEMVARALLSCGHNVILADVFMGIEQGVDFDHPAPIREAQISHEAPNIEEIIKSRPHSKDGYFGQNILSLCRQADIVFLALHGEDGENGKLQATFDLLHIRYTGNNSLSCALAMDKTVTKRLFKDAGIPTPNGYGVTKKDWERKPIMPNMPYPVVVKPANGGSSIGVSIAHDENAYIKAIEETFLLEDTLVVEEYIKGREFSVTVMDGRAFPIIEIEPLSGFYDYKNKYAPGMTKETCPADLSEVLTKRMQEIAKEVFEVFSFNTYARMDFLLDEKTNQMYCLEANTLPGMTPTSLIPQEAAQVGIDYETLCENIVALSMQKYER